MILKKYDFAYLLSNNLFEGNNVYVTINTIRTLPRLLKEKNRDKECKSDIHEIKKMLP